MKISSRLIGRSEVATNGLFQVSLVSSIGGKKLGSTLNKANLNQVGKDIEDKLYSLLEEDLIATIPVKLREPLSKLFYKTASETIDEGVDPDTGRQYAPLTELYSLNKVRYLVRQKFLTPSYPAFPRLPARLKAGSRRARKGEKTKAQLRVLYSDAVDKVRRKRQGVREALASRLAVGDILPILVGSRRMQLAIEQAPKALIEATRFTKGKPGLIRFILDVPGAEYFRFHQTGTLLSERRRIFNTRLTDEMVKLIKKVLGAK